MVSKTDKKTPKQRLSHEERREAILKAVIPLFDEKSLDQVTTRILAEAAGISEALLYQHFTSKEDLFGAVQDRLCTRVPALEAAIAGATASTESLVQYLYLFALISIKRPTEVKIDPLFPRLMVQSLIGDRTFARLHEERRLKGLCQLISESLQVAEKSGDLHVDGQFGSEKDNPRLLFWFAVHLITMVYLNQTGQKIHSDYPAKTEDLLDKTMLFIMRGFGLKEEAIKKYYNRKILNSRIMDLIGKGSQDKPEIRDFIFGVNGGNHESK